MAQREVTYHRKMAPAAGTYRVTYCGICGAVVGDEDIHTEWHFPTPTCQTNSGCPRTDNLKQCGPVGLLCPDHFVEP